MQYKVTAQNLVSYYPKTPETPLILKIQLQGSFFFFYVSPMHKPSKNFESSHAFTGKSLGLCERSYPVATLQHKFLWSLLLAQFEHAQLLVLIGSDMPHPLVTIQPVHAEHTSASFY